MARYQINPWTVEAVQLTEPMNIMGTQGNPGDWHIKRDDGYEFVLNDEHFRKAYSPAEPLEAKVVFLDVDGVLNSQEAVNAGRTSQNSKLTGNDWWANLIDPMAVQRLNRLLEQTGAKVVVTSTWRINAGVRWLQAVLEQRGFQGEVVSVTPRLHGLPRKEEIEAWLQIMRPTAYVVLDDDTDAEIVGLTVLCSEHTGLTDDDVDTAIAILNEND
jgi:hypothetical protein